jgi:hypothetical protein
LPGVLLLLTTFLAGCGRERQISGFESYVSDFEQASQSVGKPTTVGSIVIDYDPFTATDLVDLGQCEWGNLFHSPHIRINKEQWNRLGETARRILLFHELGHCVLNRDHRTDLRSDQSPASIMFPSLLRSSTYENSRDYYWQELFQEQ